MSSELEIVKLLATLGATFPAVSAQVGKLTRVELAARLDIACELLRDIPSAVLGMAFKKAVANCTSDFGPSIPDIRRAAKAIIAHESGDDAVTPEAIWQFAAMHCNTGYSASAYGTAAWDSGIEVPSLYKAALAGFGYDRWGARLTENYSVDFAQFRGIVLNLQARDKYTREMLPAENARLAGILSATASRLRLPPPPAQAEGGPVKLDSTTARTAAIGRIIASTKGKLSAPNLPPRRRVIYENVLKNLEPTT